MPSFAWRRGGVLALALLLGGVASAQEKDSAKPVDPVEILRHHLSHGIGETPLDSALIGDRNNAALLVAARNGIKATELARLFPGQTDLENRIAELEKAGLLARSGSHLHPSFVIVIEERKSKYDELIDQATDEIYDDLVPHVRALREELQSRGWSEWEYHFLWSQVFDSQFIWSAMTESGLAPPLYPAVAWVVYPQHPFKSGTNYYPDDELDEFFLAVSWTPTGSNTPGQIGGRWRLLYPSALAGKPISDEAAGALREVGLLADGNTVRIPVVRADDPLYGKLQKVAGIYLQLLAARMPQEELQTTLNAEAQTAWAIAYHDVAWELLRRLVRNGELTRPAALAPGSAAARPPSMLGVCAVVAAYQPFVDQLRKALNGDR